MAEPTFVDKVALAVVTALIAAVVGGVAGFIGSLVAEKPKRRAAQLDDIDAIVAELVADLDDAERLLARAEGLSKEEVRAILRRRHMLGEKCTYAHTANGHLPPISDALKTVDLILVRIEDASRVEPLVAVRDLNVIAVITKLKAAVNDASANDPIRRNWGWGRK